MLTMPWPADATRQGGLVVFALIATCLVPETVQSQYERAPRPGAWAMEGVTVVHGDGRTQENMTVVVRGGVIQTLRAGAETPPGARLIEWDEGTLYVYPGLVDGHGGAPTSFPPVDTNDVEAWNPTRQAQGFTPHRRAADHLDGGGPALSDLRRAGFVASAVFPGRGPIPGQPSLILHDPDGRAARDLVMGPSLGLALSFQGAQGMYPSTLMAVHALIRQRFLDAEHQGARMAASPVGAEAGVPVLPDEDMAVLRQAAAGEIAVFFRADGAEGVRRVLSLADEIGFEPVIVGGEGAGVLAEELAARNVPVLLTTDLTEPDEWDPEAEGELDPSAARERDRLLPIYETAGRMEEAGVPFALTSGGRSGPRTLDGVRRYVEHGLSEEGAIEALTLTPARLLGVPGLIRMAEGAPANFIVTDRGLLEEGMSVIWTFVNGVAEKGADPRTEAELDEPDDPLELEEVVGRWEGRLEVSDQTMPMTVELREEAGSLAGSVEVGGFGTSPLPSPRIEGGRLRFRLPVPQMDASVQFDATIQGDRMTGTGTFRSPAGEAPISFQLTRVPGGER